MQSLGEETFHFESLKHGKAGRQGAAGSSWLSHAQAHAERAARAGFVLSMVFLASAAIYGLSLSGALGTLFTDIVTVADQAGARAGYRVEDLAISGVKNTPRQQIFEALGVPYAGSSLFYDPAEAHDRLLTIGWIEAAEVRRILPSRLDVSVTERIPFARFAERANTIQIIDREGRMLGSGGDDRFGALPLFSGEGAPAEAAAFEDSLSGREDLKRRIDRAELITGRFWMVRLDNGLMLKLPRKVGAPVLDRLESLLANTKIAEMGVETIDLRLPHRTILQLREPTLANRDRAIALLKVTPGQAVTSQRKGKAS